MKRILILVLVFINVSFCHAQYSKDKLTDILTNGSTKSWTVKNSNTNNPEKSYTFNKNMTVGIGKDNGKGVIITQPDKWVLTSSDNIRWFITMGSQKFEIIVSYDKSGKQFIKLTHQAGDQKASVYSEIILYPTK